MKKIKEKDFNEKLFIWLLLIGVFLFFMLLDNFSPSLAWDENVYLANARACIKTSNFTEDFRFPGIEYILAFFWLFTGESLFVAKLVIILMSVITVFLTYLCAKRFFSKKFAFLTAILFAMSSLLIQWGFKVLGEVPSLFFSMLSFYMLLLAKERSKSLFIMLAAIFSAFAFLSRFPLILLAFSMGVYFILKKKPKELLLFVTFFIIALSPWLIYNYIEYGNPIWDLMKYNSVVQQWTVMEPVSRQLFNLVLNLRFLLPFFVIGIFSFLLKKNDENKKLFRWLILIYILVSLIYYLFFVKMKIDRYFFTFLPFLYIVSIEGLVFIKSKLIRQNKSEIKRNEINWKKIIFIILFLMVLIDSIYGLVYTVNAVLEKESCDDKESAIFQSIDYMKTKITKDDVIVSNFWPWFGYNLNVKVYSAWSSPEDLIENYSASYFIYGNWTDDFYNLTELNSNNNLVLDKEIRDKCNQEVLIYRVKNSG